MSREKEKYDDIKDSLQTFDILNCEPKGLFWKLVGHTAMVYRCRETGQLFVYESTQRGSSDSLSGVQLRPMREWLASRDKVFVRRVTFDYMQLPAGSPLLSRGNAELKCQQHIRQNRGKEYPDLRKPRWIWFLINAALDLPWKSRLRNPDIDFVMFCTMLLGDCWRFCGLSKKELLPSELEPDDMRPGEDYFFTAYLNEGVNIGEEIEIGI